MNRVNRLFPPLLCLFLASESRLDAQSDDYRFQLGAQFVAAVSGEFNGTDSGVGGRLSWQATRTLGLEGEINFFPSDFPDRIAFTGNRVEGLFGATLGPRLGAVRPFAKLRPGFVSYDEAPEPFACILIFPPPLQCAMASGRTLFALDIGGGVEWLPASRAFLRIDLGDRMIRYPGPTFDRDREVHDEGFFGHDFRFAIGGGLRF